MPANTMTPPNYALLVTCSQESVSNGTYDDNVPVERYRSQLVRRLGEEIHDKA